MFLSTRIVHTFAGYAYSQLQRIKGHKRWIDNPPSKPNPYEYGMVDTDRGGQTWTDSNKYNAYQSLLADYQAYETWKKERNPKRQELEVRYGYDTKHAMHLYRLFYEAEELLTTGRLELPLKEDVRDFLVGVRQGKIPYDNVVSFAEGIHDSLKALESFAILPKQPNHKELEKLLIRLKLNHLLDNREE